MDAKRFLSSHAKDATPQLTAKDVAAIFADEFMSALYPLLLTPSQAAKLAQVPIQTIYGWSSQGKLDGCKAKAGKHLRLRRNEFYFMLVTGKI